LGPFLSKTLSCEVGGGAPVWEVRLGKTEGVGKSKYVRPKGSCKKGGTKKARKALKSREKLKKLNDLGKGKKPPETEGTRTTRRTSNGGGTNLNRNDPNYSTLKKKAGGGGRKKRLTTSNPAK